jgi:adenylate kinase family enzyme
MLDDKRRILVIGPSGAGKSALAQRLGEATRLPVIHLDREYWQAGWKPTPDVEWKEKLDTLLERPEWVMDGSYHASLPRRIVRSDAVIFLDFPRSLCRYRVVKRILRSFGRTRPDLAPGCPEQLDWEFLRWVWRWHDDIRPGVLQELSGAGPKLLTLTTPAEAARLVDVVAVAGEP